MLTILKLTGKVLAVLNGEVSPRQIAAGFAWGAVIGLVPFSGVLPIILILLGFVININLVMMFVALGVFKVVGFFIDPIADVIGRALLVESAALHPVWTALYNAPIVPYTKFNNTVVLGSLVLGLALLVPLYFAGGAFVVGYRTRYREKINKLRIVQVAKASKVYGFYRTYRGFRGE